MTKNPCRTEGYSFEDAISPAREMAAYEALWSQEGVTFKRIADLFRENSHALPSELIGDEDKIRQAWEKLVTLLKAGKNEMPGIRVNGAVEYPEKLRDAKNPLEVFYYRGDWDLAFAPSVAVVGSRKVSHDGIRRTRKLVRLLVEDGYTIVSGMAAGVDRAAHESALENGGRTVGVLGTPLYEHYPRENAALQDQVASEHLLLSQVPFLHYHSLSDYRVKSRFFPERNVTMSALTQATVIIEASDTSGTLYQARAALAQNRKLFILDSCFKNSAISWPHKFLAKGAIRVSGYDDIKKHIPVPGARRSL